MTDFYNKSYKERLNLIKNLTSEELLVYKEELLLRIEDVNIYLNNSKHSDPVLRSYLITEKECKTKLLHDIDNRLMEFSKK